MEQPRNYRNPTPGYSSRQNGSQERFMSTYSSRVSAKRSEDERMTMISRAQRRRSIPRVVLVWSFQIILMIMIAYVLVYFFGQKRTVVGQSMDTVLAGGDEVWINTLAYQMGGPSRYDIISFKPNGNTSSRSSIRRVIALPGETVQIIDGMVYIDGKVLLEKKNYPAIVNPGLAEEPITLSDTEYFVLGDNRNNSEDSRHSEVGLVRSDMIEGKVWFILNPSDRRGLVKN